MTTRRPRVLARPRAGKPGIELKLCGPDGVEQRFVGKRDKPAHAIARRLDAVAAPWTGPRNVPTPTLWPTSALSILQEPGFAADAMDPGDGPDLPGAPG